MGNKKNTSKDLEKKETSPTGSISQYANSSFFKKKDEDAKKFLKKHPVPNTFWD